MKPTVSKLTTMQISIKMKNKIHKLKTDFKKIIDPYGTKHTSLSDEDVLKIVFCAKSIEAQVEEMIVNG